jgi:hypothetical protein
MTALLTSGSVFLIGILIIHSLFLLFKKLTENKKTKFKSLTLNPKIKLIGILAIYLCGGSIALINFYKTHGNQEPSIQETFGIIGLFISIIILIPFLFNCLTALMDSLDET